MLNRREFNKGLLATALSGLALHLHAADQKILNQLMSDSRAYGPLISDPNGMLDLPANFTYRIISKLGEIMDDGLSVPDRADGMGCIFLDEERVVLVRNHELSIPKDKPAQPENMKAIATKAFDTTADGYPLPGGTSNIIYNLKTGKVEKQFMSLIGTIRNCSGGTTPWGSWLTCEESVANASDSIGKNHGYVFEVPSSSDGLIEPVALKDMGRFNHEAACVDPVSGIVYLTEDRNDSLFYRFIPNQPGNLALGGKLQALGILDKPQFDSRNWDNDHMLLNAELGCDWIDLEQVDSPQDDLRTRGFAKGAALFARGEGIHFENGEMYFCCTSGGKQKLGQIMRYRPSAFEGKTQERLQPGTLSLFLESANKAAFNFGDNITIAPNGHLLVCEDQYSDTVNNKLKGIQTNGEIYDFAKVRWQTEPAGVCFSPDGSTLFVNLYSPTATLAIKGPWGSFTGSMS
ncbi:alkaline phosphatase PhoX [Glaciecola sp. SC05]|uniref:alkaline phosphatase PhoX n=1 Tax=Glaciecola sp. SC05 TaxID=1987355 RepID=UPI003526D342